MEFEKKALSNEQGNGGIKMGNYDEAIEYYKEAMAIFIQCLGENHSEVGEVSNNLGLVYKKQGNYSLAAAAYERAIRVHSLLLPPSK